MEETKQKPVGAKPTGISRRAVLQLAAAAGVAQLVPPLMIEARGEQPVKLGMDNPLTGTYAETGKNELIGCQLAVEQINAKGGILGRQAVLLSEDSTSGDAGTYKADNLNFDVKPMPIGGTGQHMTVGGIGLIAVATIQDQDRLKAAMELAEYLTSGQVGQDVPGYYLAPGARKSVQVSDPISKFSPFVAYTWIAPLISQWTQIRTLIHPQLQKAVLGQLSVSDALNAPANEINSILSDNS